MPARRTAFCPRCGRVVALQHGTHFVVHSVRPRTDERCPMTGMRAPITGHSPADYLARAHLVAELAGIVQDEDPARAWDYLTALPAGELQRLLALALAGIGIDRTVDEIWGWVCQLPVAKAS